MEDIENLANKIHELGFGVYLDARRLAHEFDFAGLAYIVNMANGRGGNERVLLGTLIDLADLLRGITPKHVHGIQRGNLGLPTL